MKARIKEQTKEKKHNDISTSEYLLSLFGYEYNEKFCFNDNPVDIDEVINQYNYKGKSIDNLRAHLIYTMALMLCDEIKNTGEDVYNTLNVIAKNTVNGLGFLKIEERFEGVNEAITEIIEDIKKIKVYDLFSSYFDDSTFPIAYNIISVLFIFEKKGIISSEYIEVAISFLMKNWIANIDKSTEKPSKLDLIRIKLLNEVMLYMKKTINEKSFLHMLCSNIKDELKNTVFDEITDEEINLAISFMNIRLYDDKIPVSVLDLINGKFQLLFDNKSIAFAQNAGEYYVKIIQEKTLNTYNCVRLYFENTVFVAYDREISFCRYAKCIDQFNDSIRKQMDIINQKDKKILELKSGIKKLNGEKKELEKKCENNKINNEKTLLDRIQELKTTVDELEKEKSSMRSIICEKNYKDTKSETHISILEENNASLKAQVEKLTLQINEYQENIESLNAENADLAIIQQDEDLFSVENRELAKNAVFTFFIPDFVKSQCIESLFPKSKFYRLQETNNFTIGKASQAAIVTVSASKHSTYWRVKSICEKNNVQVIECNSYGLKTLFSAAINFLKNK